MSRRGGAGRPGARRIRVRGGMPTPFGCRPSRRWMALRAKDGLFARRAPLISHPEALASFRDGTRAWKALRVIRRSWEKGLIAAVAFALVATVEHFLSVLGDERAMGAPCVTPWRCS